MKVSEADYSSITWFHKEKGDLSRWAGWEERKPFLPIGLVKAYENWVAAKEILDAVVNGLEVEWEDD